MLETSMGQNPSYYFWMWDKEERCFVKYLDLDMIGYMTFDYADQEIHVSSTGSAAYHEFATYKYINNKVTLIEKIHSKPGIQYGGQVFYHQRDIILGAAMPEAPWNANGIFFCQQYL